MESRRATRFADEEGYVILVILTSISSLNPPDTGDVTRIHHLQVKSFSYLLFSRGTQRGHKYAKTWSLR